jgi:hypothetical protein
MNLMPPPTPSVVRSTAHSQYVRPSHAQPATRSQLKACMAHMIYCVISDALMPRLVTVTAGTPPVIRYAFAVHQLVLSKLAVTHFISAIIDKDTDAVLEYCHLIKNPATKTVWETSFANKKGTCFRGYKNRRAHTRVSSSRNLKSLSTNNPCTAVSAVIFAHKRRSRSVPA